MTNLHCNWVVIVREMAALTEWTLNVTCSTYEHVIASSCQWCIVNTVIVALLELYTKNTSLCMVPKLRSFGDNWRSFKAWMWTFVPALLLYMCWWRYSHQYICGFIGRVLNKIFRLFTICTTTCIIITVDLNGFLCRSRMGSHWIGRGF